MPSPKSGKGGSAVAPTDPAVAQEADKADPGEVDQVKSDQFQSKSGKYGSVQTKPFKSDPKKKSWIEIHMVDEAKKPVTGQPFRVTMSDGETVAEGCLDQNGLARIEGIDPGNCKVTFPRLDKDAWEKTG